MIKVGFIDYFLDEWHANTYPEMMKKWAPGLQVNCAWAKIDSPRDGGLTTKAWGEKYNVEIKNTIEEVIEAADVLVVLSPDNPEMHEELCRLPLSADTELEIGEGEKRNLLVISDGEARISEASCPDHVCVKRGRVSFDGQSIVCLPNKVVVSIVGGETDGLDGVSG